MVKDSQCENRSNRITTSYPGESIRSTRNGRGIFNRAKARRRRSLMKKVMKKQSQYSMACSVQKLAARFFPFPFLVLSNYARKSRCPSAVLTCSPAELPKPSTDPAVPGIGISVFFIFYAQSSSITTSKAPLAKYPILPKKRADSPSHTQAMPNKEKALTSGNQNDLSRCCSSSRTRCCQTPVEEDVMLILLSKCPGTDVRS